MIPVFPKFQSIFDVLLCVLAIEIAIVIGLECALPDDPMQQSWYGCDTEDMDLVLKWLPDGLNSKPESLQESHQAASELMDSDALNRFKQIFWFTDSAGVQFKGAYSEGGVVDFEQPKKTGTQLVRVKAKLLAVRSTRPIHTVIIYFEVSNGLLGRKITDFQIRNDPNGELTKTFFKHAARDRVGISDEEVSEYDEVVLFPEAKSESIEVFNKILRQHPNSFLASYLRGEAYSSHSAGLQFVRPQDAVGDFTTAISLNPNFAEAYMARAHARASRGDYVGELQDYARTISLTVEDPIAFVRIGSSSPCLENLVIGSGTLSSFYYIDGVRDSSSLMIEGGKPRTPRIRDHDDSLEPNFEQLLTQGTRNLLNGSLELSDTQFNKAIELKPDSAVAYTCRGILRAHKGNREDALKDLNHAIEIAPRDSSIIFAQAMRNYFCNKDIDNAELNRAIKLSKNDVDAILLAASAIHILSDKQTALQHYNLAARLKPKNSYVLRRRGWFHYQCGNFKEALNDFSQAIQYAPESPNSYWCRSIVWKKMGESDRARHDAAKFVWYRRLDQLRRGDLYEAITGLATPPDSVLQL